MGRVILIAVDHTAVSENAFNWALAHLVKPGEDSLVLIHAQQLIPPIAFPLTPHPGLVAAAQAGDVDEREKDKKLGHKLLEQCEKAGVPATYKVFRGTSPGDVVADVAEQVKPEFVVVGSRGLSGIKRAFVGSVSDFLCHYLSVPVVVVKLDEPAEGETPATTEVTD